MKRSNSVPSEAVEVPNPIVLLRIDPGSSKSQQKGWLFQEGKIESFGGKVLGIGPWVLCEIEVTKLVRVHSKEIPVIIIYLPNLILDSVSANRLLLGNFMYLYK